jgi:hypothetical protein
MGWKRSALCSGLVLSLYPLTAAAADPPIDSSPSADRAVCESAPKVVEFRGSSTRLSPAAKQTLDDAVAWSKSSADHSLRLRGPARGGAADSKVAQRRTLAVKSYLSQKGVDPARISEGDQSSGSASATGAGAVKNASVVEVDTCSTALASATPATPATSPAGSSSPSSSSGSSVAATDPTLNLPAVPPVPPSATGIAAPVVPPPASTTANNAGPQTPPGEITDRTASGTTALSTLPNPPVAPSPSSSTTSTSSSTGYQEPQPMDNGSSNTAMNDTNDGSDRPHSRVGIGTTIGGGVIGFVDDKARAFTNPGGSWETRVTAGTREFVALEAAYVGSAQSINALGLDNNARLIGNGAEGDVRVNLTRQMVQPYLFGGLGWDHYQLSMSGTNTSSLRDKDDVLTVPFGLGLSLRVAKGLLIDLRGTARAAFYDDLMDGPYAASGQDAKLHSWNLAGRLGWEF